MRQKQHRRSGESDILETAQALARYWASDVAGERGTGAPDVGGVGTRRVRHRGGEHQSGHGHLVDSQLPFQRAYPGPNGLIRLQRDWAEGFDEVTVTTREFIDAGEDRVVARVLHAGRGAASGVSVETDIWYVFTILARKWVRADVFVDKGRAFEAAGLSE